jgi:hypothetical protein
MSAIRFWINWVGFDAGGKVELSFEPRTENTIGIPDPNKQIIPRLNISGRHSDESCLFPAASSI